MLSPGTGRDLGPGGWEVGDSEGQHQGPGRGESREGCPRCGCAAGVAGQVSSRAGSQQKSRLATFPSVFSFCMNLKAIN